MITKISNKLNFVNYISYDLENLSPEEKELAMYMWAKGWNAFMTILPNITPDELLIDGKFPYNREYTEDKEPLVRYFTKGINSFDKTIHN